MLLFLVNRKKENIYNLIVINRNLLLSKKKSEQKNKTTIS